MTDISVRTVVDHDGLRELMNSKDVLDDLTRRGRAVQAAAQHRGIRVEGVPGDVALPVTVVAEHGKGRARVTVGIDHPSGVAVEVKHRVLVGSLDAAR